MEELSALQALGLTLPSPAYIFGAVVFGLIGFAAFRYGRKAGRPRTKWLGIALMLYPYAIPWTWLLYVAGFAMCVAVVFDRGSRLDRCCSRTSDHASPWLARTGQYGRHRHIRIL